MPDRHPIYWPIHELTAAFRTGQLTPSELLEMTFERIDRIDDDLHAYLEVTRDHARQQARRATETYRRADETTPLLGVPVAVKDAFHVRDVPTTLGSLVHRGQIPARDSGVVSRLRSAGAVLTGKTNTAEFGQSATTDNLLGPSTANPWDTDRTPGGSSGGSAAAVSAGLASAAVGSDGGGSVRIPAAFCGLVGLKPTPGVCRDEHGFRAMTDFVSPGPLTWRIADARHLVGVLADRRYPRATATRKLRVAWCPRPENRPVMPGVVDSVTRVAQLLESLGHHVEPYQLPVAGWAEIFGPLVLDEEHRERGHLLPDQENLLTEYERATLLAGQRLDAETVAQARHELRAYRERLARLITEVDLLLTPTVAVPAFPIDQRPRAVDGQPVSSLWGAFPFAVPFNVAGLPALTLPCGLVDGLPVGAQLVGAPHQEQLLLDCAEELEDAIAFDATPVIAHWSDTVRRVG
ncbi:MAG: amidase [Pseudonocardiaceae bacterium]|nr:amidase [Pseudonocardiaceae bacterium]